MLPEKHARHHWTRTDAHESGTIGTSWSEGGKMLGDASTMLWIGMDVIDGPEGEGMSIVCTMEDTHLSWPSSPLLMMTMDAWWIACAQNSSIPFGNNFQ